MLSVPCYSPTSGVLLRTLSSSAAAAPPPRGVLPGSSRAAAVARTGATWSVAWAILILPRAEVPFTARSVWYVHRTIDAIGAVTTVGAIAAVGSTLPHMACSGAAGASVALRPLLTGRSSRAWLSNGSLITLGTLQGHIVASIRCGHFDVRRIAGEIVLRLQEANRCLVRSDAVAILLDRGQPHLCVKVGMSQWCRSLMRHLMQEASQLEAPVLDIKKYVMRRTFELVPVEASNEPMVIATKIRGVAWSKAGDCVVVSA